MNSLSLYWTFTRPFTLLPPLLGIVSGAITAVGAIARRKNIDIAEVFANSYIDIILGAAMASFLNAASNCLNQIYDIENDRINKPHRPLVTGKLSRTQAMRFTIVLYAIALLLAWFIAPDGTHECFWIVAFTAFLTYAYSCPPLRTKRLGAWANLTIAIPRGLLLKVAGWSCVATIWNDSEPWFIGVIFFCFILGATTTKDYSDIKGDLAAGCQTLPIRYGIETSAKMIMPFFVLPWLLLLIGALRGVLSGNTLALCILAIVSMAYGSYIAYLIMRNPRELAATENHPSWTHMYLLMMLAQVGLCVAYLL